MGKHAKQREIERACTICGKTFLTGSSIKAFCSPECRIRDAASGFEGNGGCWEWAGSRNPVSGYGQLSYWKDGRRKLLTAHRASFLAFVGPIPDRGQVLHKCDNRPCFNPAHLFIGDQLANMRDMIGKGRQRHRTPRGALHPKTKITDADVLAIRASKEGIKALAARYGMSLSAIWAIRARKTWTHL